MKKYFLKDTTLTNIDDDQFRYQDFANNLRLIIKANKSPFNIAVVGKWGLGKSSLVNMALEPLKKDQDYLICEINAWKYEKDEIGKAFLKELWEGISKKKVLSFSFFHKEYSDIVKKMFEDKSLLHKKGSIFAFLKFIGITVLISIILFFVYCQLSNEFYGIKFSGVNFLISSFLRYCKNIGSILIIPLVVWLGKLFMDKLNTPASKNYEISFPLETQSDYEIYLKNLLDDYYGNKPNIKIVVTIDDLDRLSAEKIVEALDALKVFMEYDRFIFIVPFDDEILKNALIRKRIENISTFDNEYDGEMVLDKLFQYKIYLPQLIKNDMRNYAFEICKENCSDFINEYCNNNYKLFEEIVGKILIHSNVSTPRQVKKIVNTFIENVMVSRDREDAGKVTKGFATDKKGLLTIAKIAVLQSDYNNFYDLLFSDSNVINEILEVHRDNSGKVPSVIIRNYFEEINDGEFVLKRKYEPLVNFLIFTENLGHTNITPYLYMAQTKTGVLVGDKKQQDFMAAIESCNLTTVKQLLKDTPILISSLIEQLVYNESTVMGNIIVSAIDCFDVVEGIEKEELAFAIDERIPSLFLSSEDYRYDLLNIEDLINICQMADSNKYNDLIESAMYHSDRDEDDNKTKVLIYKISSIRNKLSETTCNKFEKFTKQWISSQRSKATTIVEYATAMGTEYISNVYGKEYINKIASYITNNDDFNENVLAQFGDVVEAYLKTYSISEIESALLPCFEYPIMHSVLDKSIVESKYKEAKDQKAIATKIVTIGAKKLKGVFGYNILSKLEYDIDSKDRELFDKFFEDTIGETQFSDMITSFAKCNSLDVIPNTIEKLIENAFGDDGYSSDIRKLLKWFSEEQTKQFWKKMETSCQFATAKEFIIPGGLLDELSKDKEYDDSAKLIIHGIVIPGVESYYTQIKYLLFSIQSVSLYKDILDKCDIEKYCAAIIKAISLETNIVINAYRTIHKLISSDIWCANVSTIINYVSKETYSTIYDIFTSRIELFSKENSNLSQLNTFFVDYIGFSNDPDDVINMINREFSKIVKLDNLIHELMDIPVEEDNASLKLSKFIDGCDISDIIQIIKSEWNDDDVRREKIFRLFAKSNKFSRGKIIDSINNSKSQLNKNDISFILSFNGSAVMNENIKNLVDIMEFMLENYFEKDICLQILNNIGGLQSDVIDLEKERICILLANIFREATSEEIKQKCAILIKDKRLSRKMRNKFTESELKEYKSYLS